MYPWGPRFHSQKVNLSKVYTLYVNFKLENIFKSILKRTF